MEAFPNAVGVSAPATPFVNESQTTLRALVRRSHSRSLLAIAFDWAIIGAVAIVCERAHIPGLYAVAVIVIARQMNALFELHHHAIHGNLFRRKDWNARMQILYSIPLGLTIDSERDDHLEHHRTFNTVERDYRNWGTGYGLDLDQRSNRRYMTWFLCIRPFLGPLQLADLIETVRTRRWRLASYRNAVGGFWLTVVAVLIAAGRIDLLFWYWLVPRFTLFPILFFWDDMLGHYNCPRTGTREMRGLWFRLFSTHGTNFHNVHHINPAVPWFNMKKATRLTVDETRVDVAHGFIDGIGQMMTARD